MVHNWTRQHDNDAQLRCTHTTLSLLFPDLGFFGVQFRVVEKIPHNDSVGAVYVHLHSLWSDGAPQSMPLWVGRTGRCHPSERLHIYSVCRFLLQDVHCQEKVNIILTTVMLSVSCV